MFAGGRDGAKMDDDYSSLVFSVVNKKVIYVYMYSFEFSSTYKIYVTCTALETVQSW